MRPHCCEKQLARKSYVCKPITLGANTDPYQPVERRMKVTRSILEVLVRTRHPVSVITKSALVLRDLDLLTELARAGIDQRRAEHHHSGRGSEAHARAARRIAAGAPAHGAGTERRRRSLAVHGGPGNPGAHRSRARGDPGGVRRRPGSRWAGYVLLRLPYEIKDLFREWLAEHYPQRAAHVMSVIRDMRGGRDNDPRFGTRMRGTGPYAELLAQSLPHRLPALGT